MTSIRLDVVFRVRDQTVAAWWYPAGDAPGPALVMAHGFGMTKACLLDRQPTGSNTARC